MNNLIKEIRAKLATNEKECKIIRGYQNLGNWALSRGIKLTRISNGLISYHVNKVNKGKEAGKHRQEWFRIMRRCQDSLKVKATASHMQLLLDRYCFIRLRRWSTSTITMNILAKMTQTYGDSTLNKFTITTV